MAADHVQFTAIASGDQISPAFKILRGTAHALWAPTITSGQLNLLASFDSTSANFVRVADPRSPNADFAWDVGPGSATLPLLPELAAYAHVKVDLSVAQTDTRTFAVITRL